MRLVVGTRNPGKLGEIRAIVESTAERAATRRSIRLVGLRELDLEPTPDEARLETEPTFSGNALAKARHFHGRTGLPALADDSGLCVDALDGEPGVRSRRHAPAEARAAVGTDAANNAHLLKRLEGVPDDRRTAHFVCAVALVLEDVSRVFTGRVNGLILHRPRGEGGFGYDPLFYLPEVGRTLAELTPEEKNRWSHRARAVAAARDWLYQRVATETSRGEIR